MSHVIARDRYDSGRPHGLMFHRFRSSGADDYIQGALTPDEFERILLYVGIERICSPREWITRLREHRLGNQDVCITFDDGLRSQIEHALPVLNRYGLRAFWFVYSCVFEGIPVKSELYTHAAGLMGGMGALIEALLDRCPPNLLRQLDSKEFRAYARTMREEYPFYSLGDIKYRFLRGCPLNKGVVEGIMDRIIYERGCDQGELIRRVWMTEADLKRLAEDKHEIGLHSYDHPYEMGLLVFKEQQRQYEANYTHIRMVTGRQPISMAHPLGSYNDDSLGVLKKLGIECGFRSSMQTAASVSPKTAPLELAREDAATILPETLRSSPLARLA